MIEFLRIHDFALIESAELEFSGGINALTGESGAGKSFVIKALQFLFGEKFPAETVRTGAEKAVVEAIFKTADEEEIIIRRELIRENGRTRSYVNDALSSLDTVRDLREKLVFHVGQHGQQKLLQPNYQTALIDASLAPGSLLSDKAALAKELREKTDAIASLKERYVSLRDRKELFEMQQAEIDKVAPEKGEEERLEAMRAELKKYERIRDLHSKGLALLYGEGGEGLLDLVGRLDSLLAQMHSDGSTDAEAPSLAAFEEDLRGLAAVFRSSPVPDISSDPEEIESRLYELSQLKRKMRRSLDEILNLKDEIAQNLSFLDECALDIKRLRSEEKDIVLRLAHALALLNEARRREAALFCASLETELKGLGFSDKIRVIPEFPQTVLRPETAHTPSCIEEKIRLLWAPNPGQPPRPLEKIASGGELSRFLLAVVSIRQTDLEDAVLIFDEIDAGIGGMTLLKVGECLERLSSQKQVILITHWPQLASRASAHFLISKSTDAETTTTSCRRLSDAERVAELKRMNGES